MVSDPCMSDDWSRKRNACGVLAEMNGVSRAIRASMASPSTDTMTSPSLSPARAAAGSTMRVTTS